MFQQRLRLRMRPCSEPEGAAASRRFVLRLRSALSNNRKSRPCRNTRRRGQPPWNRESVPEAFWRRAAGPNRFLMTMPVQQRCLAGRVSTECGPGRRRTLQRARRHRRRTRALRFCSSPLSKDGASSRTAERQLGSQNTIFLPAEAAAYSDSEFRSACARAFVSSPLEIKGRPQQ